MNSERRTKKKWYNAFTREQLIERCEYLQRSCERKENSIMELEMENADLDTKIEKLNNFIDELEKWLKEEIERLMTIEQSNNVIFLIGAYTEVLDKIEEFKGEIKSE